MQKVTLKFTAFLGVDVGKRELAVYLCTKDGKLDEAVFPNTAEGLGSLVKWLNGHGIEWAELLVCLEYTGVYAEPVCMVLHGLSATLWQVSAARLKGLQLELDRRKTDELDARKIAHFALRFQDQVQPYEPDNEHIRRLKDYARMRGQLVSQRQRALGYFEAYSFAPKKERIMLEKYRKQIDFLTQEIKELDQMIRQLIKETPGLKRYDTILRSIPGIGAVTATKLITVTKGFTQMLNHKKLASFGGTAPFARSSGGSSRTRRISRKADRKLKELLTTAVLSCIAPNRIYHQYYHHLLKKPGRKHLQAVNIIRNKLLKIAVTLIKNDQLFNRDIFLNNLNLPQLDLELA